MKKVQLMQTIANMEEGRIYFYTQVKENDNWIRKDIFSISMSKYNEISSTGKFNSDEEIDAIVVKDVYKKIYGKEYFEVINMDNEDITPDKPTEDQIIREEYASKNMTLGQMLDELEKEKNLFDKMTGILRLTAKFRMIVLNELIENRFSEMETEYEEIQKKIDNMKGVEVL